MKDVALCVTLSSVVGVFEVCMSVSFTTKGGGIIGLCFVFGGSMIQSTDLTCKSLSPILPIMFLVGC